ncbi:MAG: hypothetical protein Q8P49_04515 [Candidatus Liptonbacteria bacterium]|nr:hypothetical protein [Candidatus Liptonbacteria bacterium]
MNSKRGWLKGVLDDAHRELMTETPSTVRVSINSGEMSADKRPLAEVVSDFLKSNSGKAYTFEALMDHVNAFCGDRYSERDFKEKFRVLLLRKKMRKIGSFFTSTNTRHRQ